MIYDTIIIGSGPSGLTAGTYASRDNLKTLILGGRKWGGQLMLTSTVDNFPGFPEGIEGPQLMEQMKQQAARFGTEIKLVDVTEAKLAGPGFKVKSDEGEEYEGKTVIIATGADTLWLNLPNEQKLIGKGVSSCAPCDAFFFRNKRVVVVGGGDAAMEEAHVLSKFASEVIMVHRRAEFRASKIMQERTLALQNVKVLWNTEVADVLGEMKVEGLELKTSKTDTVLAEKVRVLIGEKGGKIVKDGNDTFASTLPTDGIFVAIGHQPNSKLFAGQVALDKKGYIVRAGHLGTEPPEFVSEYWSATNIPGVFVAGDVHDHHYRQAVTAAAFGCMAAMDVGRYLGKL